jgi:hypothetical protein
MPRQTSFPTKKRPFIFQATTNQPGTAGLLISFNSNAITEVDRSRRDAVGGISKRA